MTETNPLHANSVDSRLSRRTLLAALGITGGMLAVAIEPSFRANAAPLWGHPFTFQSGISDRFGTRGGAHQGIDYIPGLGTPIHAVADGVVTISGVTGSNGAYGESVWIDHGGGYRSISAHMQPGTRVGRQNVARGQYIGRVGYTGRVVPADSRGAHLHLEIHSNGVAINPEPLVHNAPLAGTSTQTPQEWDTMASKDEIKAALAEVLNARPPQGVIFQYSSGTWRNGIALAAPGYWHTFSAEQWKQFTDHGLNQGLRVVVPINDSDYDLLRAAYTANEA